jgi:hypothetical protein
MAAGSLTLGGNASIAVGPLGRNGEASGSLNTSGKVAAMYSYSKTRGLFGGISIEGSVIMERQDANVQAYRNESVTAKLILSGSVDTPPWAAPLVKTLEACTGLPGSRTWINDSRHDTEYAFGGGLASPGAEKSPSLRKIKKTDKSPYPPASWGEPKNSGSYFESDSDDLYGTNNRTSSARPFKSVNESHGFDTDDFLPSNFGRKRSQFDYQPEEDTGKSYNRMSSYTPSKKSIMDDDDEAFNPFGDLAAATAPVSAHGRSMSMASPFSSNAPRSSNPFSSKSADLSSSMGSMSLGSPTQPYIKPKPELTRPLLPREGVARAIALYTFNGVEVSLIVCSYMLLLCLIEKYFVARGFVFQERRRYHRDTEE